MQNGDTRADASVGDNLVPVVHAFVDYAAGGLSAFSQVVEHPNVISHNWQIYNPALLILNHLGAHFEVPGANAEFISIGPEGLTTNVYTIYFAYIDFGWFVAMLFLCGIGFVVSWVYLRAMAGSKILTVLYTYFFAAIVLSTFSDYFFMGLNFSAKLVAVSWIVYGLPFRWSQFRELCARGAGVDVPARHRATS
jgi:oligosaccharide repeat unit polymerase